MKLGGSVSVLAGQHLARHGEAGEARPDEAIHRRGEPRRGMVRQARRVTTSRDTAWHATARRRSAVWGKAGLSKAGHGGTRLGKGWQARPVEECRD
jgi:hypothetical protein